MQLFVALLIVSGANAIFLKKVEPARDVRDDQPVEQVDVAEDVGSQIVGGWIADYGQYPWQVGLWWKNSHRPFCGGSIIASQ